MKEIAFLFFIFLFPSMGFAQKYYPGKAPGIAQATVSNTAISLQNDILAIHFKIGNNQIHPFNFIDKNENNIIDLHSLDWFSLRIANGESLSDKDFQLTGRPQIKPVVIDMASSKYADHIKGKMITASFINKLTGLQIKWEAQLRDGSNYVRQRWIFQSKDSIPVTRFSMIQIPSALVRQEGTVDGTPLVCKEMFFALEHPMSRNDITTKEASCFLDKLEALQSSGSFVITTVAGVTPKGQLRRGFLYYVERERSHPYRPYLHYNSWFDLSWVDRKMEESSCLERIRFFGDSLIKKRKVQLKAFLFDDGWDDNASLWQIRKSFPDGFTNMSKLAKSYGAHLGLWISPWGGYDSAKMERLKYGRLQKPPFETNENGFSLAGPVYFKRFNDVVTGFIKKYGISILKFDGVGAGNGESGAGLHYQKDIEALLSFIKKLKTLDPDLFISLTVGTWPSPYWLNYGDAIWRAGSDVSTMGKGSKRCQWITYRDAESYKNVVQRAPLYPLNSVMLHGICISSLGTPAVFERDLKNVSDEIWSFFATGTCLQELYINPHLLTSGEWDCLAKAAKWAQNNSDILKDTHWAGGDPAKGDIYGYASWAPRKGILSLRNPSEVKKTFEVNLADIFELPAGASSLYKLKTVIDNNGLPGQKEVNAHTTFTVTLEPFELKIWEAIPVAGKK